MFCATGALEVGQMRINMNLMLGIHNI